MRRRSKSTWRNRAYRPCRRRDQRKWCVLFHTHADKNKTQNSLQIGWFMNICVGVNGYHEVDVICDWLLQAPIQKRKKPGSQKKRRFKTHNDHLNGVLEDYSEGVPSKKWHTCSFKGSKWQDWYLCDVCISDLTSYCQKHKDMQTHTHTHTHTLKLYWVTRTDCKYFLSTVMFYFLLVL